MRKLGQKAVAVMQSKKSYGFFTVATFLHALSLIYGVAARSRRHLYAKSLFPKYKLPCPVVSVGNLTVGGTGKTPMVMELARWLHQQGKNVSVVSRGYKGQAENRVAVVSDGVSLLCNVGESGDEPFLMATHLKGIPVVVGKDRVAAGRTAIDRFHPDIIILDDAYQHQRLERDLNLLLLDAQAPFGNGHLLPRGTLREPVSSIYRADAVIFTRCQSTQPARYNEISGWMNPDAIFKAFHKPVIRCVLPPMHPVDIDAIAQRSDGAVENLSGRRLFAFSGLARNDSFWRSIGELGGQLQAKLAFDDHYAFQPTDIDAIIQSAKRSGSDCLVTTEKDYVRLPSKTILPMELVVLGISIDFRENQVSWQQFISDKLAGLRGRH